MRKCLFGHAPIDAATVWHDGLDYRANCPRCDAPMIQDFYLGVWRPFEATDYAVLRSVRPAASQRSPSASER